MIRTMARMRMGRMMTVWDMFWWAARSSHPCQDHDLFGQNSTAAPPPAHHCWCSAVQCAVAIMNVSGCPTKCSDPDEACFESAKCTLLHVLPAPAALLGQILPNWNTILTTRYVKSTKCQHQPVFLLCSTSQVTISKG